MKHNTVIHRFFLHIAVLLLFISLLFSILFYFFVRDQLNRVMYKEITHTSQIIKEAMVTADDSRKTIERLIDEKLFYASKEIARRLRGKSINEITRQELVELKKDVGVYDISLFVKKGDDIVVAQSSDPNEVGLSSKNWGYWFTAFQQLMSGQEVTVRKGYYIKHFWSGPISKSEWEDKYYKYAYYYDGTTSFMINPYILDQDIYKLTHNHGPSQVIKKIIESQDKIIEIAVINVPAWLKGNNHEIIEPERDSPILFGRHTFTLKDDRRFFQKTIQTNKMLSTQFSKGDRSYTKFYIPLKPNKVLVIVSDYEKEMSKYYKLLWLFISSFVFSIILIFVILRSLTKKHLQPLAAITKHIQSISKGRISQTLQIYEENEWGIIAQNLNNMTRNISKLIIEIKYQISSLVNLSLLLNETINTSLKTIDELSSSIAVNSQEILDEIDRHIAKLSHFSNEFYSVMQSIKADEKKKETLAPLLQEVEAMLDNFRSFAHYYIPLVTNTHLLSRQTVQDIELVINQLTNLAQDLEKRIKVFQLEE
jgi:hypothetical protein